MAIVVGQTLPFSSQALGLENASRWTTLFPLIRPSVKAITTTKGQKILVDTALASSKFVHIIAHGNSGSLSSKVLDGKHITAIITETSGAGVLTASDLPYVLQGAGINVSQGVVVVRAGKKREIHSHTPDVIEITTEGELEYDHVLHLLGRAGEGIRMNPHNVSELLKTFVKDSRTTHSKFHTEKVDGNPAIMHADEVAGYDKAKFAVQRDLKAVLKKLEASGDEEVVHSVHFSDLNGLSRLENYIIAGEVAQFLDAQKIAYTLSHSTILNHSEAARGFSISICPLPTHFISADLKPKKNNPIAGTSTSSTKAKATSPSTQNKMTFNDNEIRKRIEAGCNAVIKAEPIITEYDTIVGDGDCGYTLRDGAKKVLTFIANKDLSQLPSTVADLVAELEVNMGGTSGALYCIYLTALAASLASEDNIPAALQVALQTLCKYTNARVGDRTMMDALIPFIETLASNGGDAKPALEKAGEGVEGTKKMEAKLGRSTYLDESATRGVPDPGAYGLLVLFEGMTSV